MGRSASFPKGDPLWLEEDGILASGCIRKSDDLSLVEFTRPDLLIETTGGFKINPEKPQFATPVI